MTATPRLRSRRRTEAAASNGKVAPAGAGGSSEAADALEVAPDGSRMGELLVRRGVLTAAQVADALLAQTSSGRRLGTLLVELGALDERELVQVLADQLGLDQIDLGRITPDAEALALLPDTLVRELSVLPVTVQDDGTLDVVVADPSDALAHRLTEVSGHRVRMLLAPPSEVRRGIDGSYRALVDLDRHVTAFETTDAKRKVATTDQITVGADAPVVNIVNLLLTQALRDRASDVHIEPQETQLRVRFRIDGALHDVSALPASMGPALVSRIKIMAGMNIVERRRSQDGQMAIQVDGRDIDIRVATTATIWGEKCVLRVLDKSRSLYRMSELGMPADTHETLSRLVRAPFGMVLCAGPTGSGKTTTLYATLGEINEPHRNIMTIEDPVEYVFPQINQIQTNEQAGLTFASGLKSILRQDPDVILVGEIRDVETARIAIQSALTGHFVLSSLHGTDAVAAIHRFLDMGIESFLVSSSLLAVVGQRLVRRNCTSCMVKYKPETEELAFFEESGGTPKRTFWRGEGCNFCSGTGYRDRVGVYELLRITPEIKRLIVGWATQEELRRMAVSQGMRTLRDEATALVENDHTTLSEVIRTIYAF